MDDVAKKVAIGAIKEKLRSLVEEREAIERERMELDQRSRRIDVGIMDCRSAARLFGIEVEIPEELALIRSIMAQRNARIHGEPGLMVRPVGAGSLNRPPMINATPSRAQASTAPSVSFDQKSLFGASEPSVREIVLAYLRRAHLTGVKASTLREFVERVLKKQIHEKTVGMTLYRLSKGEPPLVRRDGQMWFYAGKLEDKGSTVSAAEP
jgi:hypothetical protein